MKLNNATLQYQKIRPMAFYQAQIILISSLEMFLRLCFVEINHFFENLNIMYFLILHKALSNLNYQGPLAQSLVPIWSSLKQTIHQDIFVKNFKNESWPLRSVKNNHSSLALYLDVSSLTVAQIFLNLWKIYWGNYVHISTCFPRIKACVQIFSAFRFWEFVNSWMRKRSFISTTSKIKNWLDKFLQALMIVYHNHTPKYWIAMQASRL